MPGLMAEDAVREHGSAMSADQLYEAMLAATGSTTQAEQTVRQQLAAKLRRGETPK